MLSERGPFDTILRLYLKIFGGLTPMLGFFTKYQRFFFIVVTFVIVISFSFFGANTAFQNAQVVDKTAFIAVDGTEVPRSELESVALFIGTDNEDKLLLGGRWGPNFLNDGVIKRNFLETGIATELVDPFIGEFETDFSQRHKREKHFSPYQHPQAQFISATNAWNAVAPEINQRLAALRKIDNPASKEGFDARVQLYMAERRFPHGALRMVLAHQQKQYNWVRPDPNLNRIDLALFGYHTVDDWFGTRFTRLVSEFIINSAIIAKERGYEVSKGEALADLYRNAETSFQQNVNNPNLGLANSKQYFNEQLRRMGMDPNQAVAIWQKVMLFRRLFQDLGNSVWVDPFTVEQFQHYAKHSVNGELFQLPQPLRLTDFNHMQRFETYLSAISERPQSGMEMLEIPESYKSVDQIAKETPELVERRFVIESALVNKRDLQAKVGVKDTWLWQVKDVSWEKLKTKFPELGVKKGETQKERYTALDGLDRKTRARVDTFTREQIVEEHPEWLTQSLREAEVQKHVIGLRKKGESRDFIGLKNQEELIALLDSYPKSKEKLARFSADDQTFYKIEVLDSSPGFEVLTFEEANSDGTLEKLLNSQLEKYYQANRSSNTKAYQNKDGSWKLFASVQNQVAQEYFRTLLQEINKYYSAVTTADAKIKPMIGDYAATVRLYAFMRGLKEQFKADPSAISEWVIDESPVSESEIMAVRAPLDKQWKIEKASYVGDRSTADLPMNEDEVFALSEGGWTSVHRRANGSLSFFRLQEKSELGDASGVFDKVMHIQRAFSIDAQNALMKSVMQELDDKNALSLDFLSVKKEIEE